MRKVIKLKKRWCYWNDFADGDYVCGVCVYMECVCVYMECICVMCV